MWFCVCYIFQILPRYGHQGHAFKPGHGETECRSFRKFNTTNCYCWFLVYHVIYLTLNGTCCWLSLIVLALMRINTTEVPAWRVSTIEMIFRDWNYTGLPCGADSLCVGVWCCCREYPGEKLNSGAVGGQLALGHPGAPRGSMGKSMLPNNQSGK